MHIGLSYEIQIRDSNFVAKILFFS